MGVYELFELLKSKYYLPGVTLKVTGELGPCEYCIEDKSITLRTAGRSEKELYFSLLHEVRHSLQHTFRLFEFDFNLSKEYYFSAPWEQDANNWAKSEGIKLGLFDGDFVPWWLSPSLNF